MLVANNEILVPAMKNGYAVGAFNISNLESLQAIVEAALEEHSPLIIAATPSTIKYAGLDNIVLLVRNVVRQLPLPASLHLDHGKDLEIVKKCVDAGFTSVMIDGSHLKFEENVAITRKAVDIAHAKGVSVEAELGRLAGIEETAVEEQESFFTDPEAARKFVEETDVDALAIAIGTSHGAYKFKGEPKLDFERLKAIRRNLDIPLVLHGASSVPQHIIEKAIRYGAKLKGARGIPEEHIKKAISLGISKINIDTDLRLAFTAAVRETLTVSPETFDPRKILGPARQAMKEVVKSKMRLFGSSNKA